MVDYLLVIVGLILVHFYLMYTTKFINSIYNEPIYIDSSINESYPLTNNTYKMFINMNENHNNPLTYI